MALQNTYIILPGRPPTGAGGAQNTKENKARIMMVYQRYRDVRSMKNIQYKAIYQSAVKFQFPSVQFVVYLQPCRTYSDHICGFL